MQIAKALDQQENVPQVIKTKSIQISFLHKKRQQETPMSWGIVVGKIRRNDHPHLIAWSLKDQQGLPEIARNGSSWPAFYTFESYEMEAILCIPNIEINIQIIILTIPNMKSKLHG